MPDKNDPKITGRARNKFRPKIKMVSEDHEMGQIIYRASGVIGSRSGFKIRRALKLMPVQVRPSPPVLN